MIADRTAYNVRYTAWQIIKPVSVTHWRTAGTHDPIQRVEFMNASKLNPFKQGRSQRGEMGECPPVMDWKKFLAPELQTDGCFATCVTRHKLLKPNEYVQFQRWFFETFLGTPILGRGAVRLRRSSASRLARDLRSLHRRVPPYKNPGYAPAFKRDWPKFTKSLNNRT